MSELDVGIFAGILIGASATYLAYGFGLRLDLAMLRRAWREANVDREKWHREAIRLANDDTYRGMHGAVVLVESKLGIEPSRTLTVWERWEKLSGRIDPHMLKVLLSEKKRDKPSRKQQRAAKKMILLARLAKDPASSEFERAAADNILKKMIAKYGEETMLT